MRKKLVRHGNSSALVLDRTLLQLLKINKDSEIEIEVQGNTLTISPVDGEAREAKLASVLEKVNKNHEASLKKLAS